VVDLLAEMLPGPHPALRRRVLLIQNTSAKHIMSPFKGGRWGTWRTWGIKPTRMTKERNNKLIQVNTVHVPNHNPMAVVVLGVAGD